MRLPEEMVPLQEMQNNVINDEVISMNRALESLRSRQIVNIANIQAIQVKLTQFDESMWEVQDFKENIVQLTSNSLTNIKLIDRLEKEIHNIKELMLNHRIRINEELSKHAKKIKVCEDNISDLQIREANSYIFEENIESKIRRLEILNACMLFFLLISFLYVFF